MRDEVTGPVIVPRNFHCVTRILTYNMDKAVRNEGTVGTDPFSEGFIPLLLQKKKKKEKKFSLYTRYHEHLFSQQVS